MLFIRSSCLDLGASTMEKQTLYDRDSANLSSFSVPLPSPMRLQEVSVPIVPHKECQGEYEGIVNITRNMICAGQGGKDTCQVSLSVKHV